MNCLDIIILVLAVIFLIILLFAWFKKWIFSPSHLNFEENTNKLILTIIFIYYFFVIPNIVNFIVTFPTSFGFITNETRGAWIGFYGTVISSVIAIGGIYFTIVSQNKSQKQELALQYKPKIGVYSLGRSGNLPWSVSVKNIGKGDAKNIWFDSGNEDLFTLTMESDTIAFLSPEMAEDKIQFTITVDQDYFNSVKSDVYNNKNKRIKKIDKNYKDRFQSEIIVRYLDLFGNELNSRVIAYFEYHNNSLEFCSIKSSYEQK